MKSELNQFFSALNQRRCCKEPVLELGDKCIEEKEEEKRDVPTEFLQTQKNQITDLQDHFGRYYSVLPLFAFNGTEYDSNLMESYLLPPLVTERGIEPLVIQIES